MKQFTKTDKRSLWTRIAGQSYLLAFTVILIKSCFILFKPYIIHELITKFDKDGLPCKPIATNIKEAEKMILRQDSLI
mgnify:CR=1 FL=1